MMAKRSQARSRVALRICLGPLRDFPAPTSVSTVTPWRRFHQLRAKLLFKFPNLHRQCPAWRHRALLGRTPEMSVPRQRIEIPGRRGVHPAS